MSKLLIRAWDKIHKKMRYNYLGKTGDGEGDFVLFHAEYDDQGLPVWGGNNQPYPRNQFLLMLASSVRATNGSIIYDSDIVQDPRGNVYVASFDGVAFYAHGSEADKILSNMEWVIVDNIFEGRRNDDRDLWIL